MGNDGGSIPDRRDLVRTKAKAEQADKANQTRARWFFCALSKKPLQEPIVSCALGKLYNKDAVLEYLLDKSTYGDGEEVCGHIKSLKDFKELKLTPNPVPAPTKLDSDTQRAPYVCPLTLKEMNGALPFVYLSTCGCVLSQAGLKALAGAGTSTPPSDSQGEEAENDRVPGQQLDLCPQCGSKYDKKTNVRTINPDKETEEVMRVAMLAKQKEKSSKKEKKSKKRKADDGLDEKDRDLAESKKSRPAPSLNPSIAAASRAVTASLAAEEAKRKAGMSEAVKSLYEGKGGGQKETFMTRTFNRYA